MDERPAVAPPEWWDVAAFSQPPSYTEAGVAEVGIRPILFDGGPYRGRPSRVFAYFGVPKTDPPAAPSDLAAGGVPGMVLVHGGGGTAFREWVALWNARGYAAIAMDLGGCGASRSPLSDGGPPQDNDAKFADPAAAWRDHWVCHAVSNVLRAHSLLRSEPGVDPARIGVTGISWGGYLTCIVAGLDARFGCAIPVYGCGFLQRSSGWLDVFAAMTGEQRRRWHERCDPSMYIGNAAMPMLFVNGTTDTHYRLDSYQRTYRLVRGRRALAVHAPMAHGHAQGWSPVEIGRFADHQFRGAPALPALGEPSRTGSTIMSTIETSRPIVSAELAYTRDSGSWPDRLWHHAAAQIDVSGGGISARVPQGTTACFFAVRDDLGGYASSPIDGMDETC